MTRTKNRVLVSIAGLTLLAAPAAAVVVPQKAGSREFRHPGLTIPSLHTPSTALGSRDEAQVPDLSRLEDLRGISLEPGRLVLGARTTYSEIRRSALCREHLPALVEAAATIGAAQIQNRGTIGGNVANASPAGDTLPILLATDAVILVGGQRGEREIPAAEFFIDYRRTALAPDELILQVRFPLVRGREIRFRKVGTRRAQAISKVVMTLAWVPDASGAWRDVRVAYGSIAPVPVHAGVPADDAARTATIDGSKVEVAGLRFDLPEIFRSEPPASPMRLFQATVAGESGPAELVVFHFGAGQGGTVEANLERWLGQIERPAGVEPERGTLPAGGLQAHWVDAAGTLLPTGMGMGPATPQPGSRLLGAVVEGGEGPWFFKLTGPAATVAAARPAFLDLLRSLRPAV